MKLTWFYILAFILFPFYAVFYAYIYNGSIEGYSVNLDITISYFIHLTIMLIIASIISKHKISINYMFSDLHVNRVLNKCIFIALIEFFLVVIFGGYEIIFQRIYRGDLRLTIGLLGPLYNFIILYVPIALVSISSIIYISSNRIKKFKFKLFIIYTLVLAIGFFSGSKATIIIVTIPGIAILTIKKSFKIILFISIIASFLLIFMTMFVRQIELESAVTFLINRATNMSAYGTIAIWNELSDSIKFDKFIINFLSIFGSHITTLLTGYEKNSIEFLDYNVSRLITYMVYPDSARALDGSVNLTVTNFGEAIFFFGRDWFWVYSIISGAIIGIVLKNLKKNISLSKIKIATLFNVYFFAIVVPWINSGGVFGLMSLPNFIYLTSIYVILLFICSDVKKIKSKYV